MRNRQPGRTQAPRLKGLGNAGMALAEMAIALPFLMILLLGSIDFGRVFYASIAVTQAARAAAAYGAQNSGAGTGSLYPGMQAAAASVATDYGVAMPTPTVERYCTCSTGGATVSCSSLCDGASPQRYVTATISNYQFNTFTGGHYPGIPGTVTLSRTATIRVQ